MSEEPHQEPLPDQAPEEAPSQAVTDPAPEATPVAAAPVQGHSRRWVIAGIIVLVLAWPLVRWVANRGTTAPIGQFRAAGPPTTAAGFVELALEHYRAGRFQECIDASQQALKLGGNLDAIAYNNLGACSGSLGRYDDDIKYALEALRLKPDFQLASNNLVWAIAQKKQQSKTK